MEGEKNFIQYTFWWQNVFLLITALAHTQTGICLLGRLLPAVPVLYVTLFYQNNSWHTCVHPDNTTFPSCPCGGTFWWCWFTSRLSIKFLSFILNISLHTSVERAKKLNLLSVCRSGGNGCVCGGEFHRRLLGYGHSFYTRLVGYLRSVCCKCRI